MSYGHADKIIAAAAGTPAANTPPIDLALYSRDDLRRILADRDITALYLALKEAGLTQRRIAELTGMKQSEVSDILAGRRVQGYDVLVRIAQGLRIPRDRMGLSYGASSAYRGDEATATDPPEEVNAAMKRRTVVGALSVAVVGTPLLRFGEQLIELALPAADEPLPTRLDISHVHTVRTATGRLRDLARQHGGHAELFSAAARHYTRWLNVPATDVVQALFKAALSELHTETGWCCYDSGVDPMGYFTRAAQLSDDAGDAYGIVNAAYQAGATMVRSGHPDDALKCFQLGQFQLAGHTKTRPVTFGADDPRMSTLAARLDMVSAAAYALMDYPKQARDHLARARDAQIRDPFARAAVDLNAAMILRDLGHLDAAESHAETAARGFGEHHGRVVALAGLVRAELHVRAGEPRGMALAKTAVESVSALRSVSLRSVYLPPLADALARRGPDAEQLARRIRQVATTAA
jgi:transcriptional regulator with XRE-family HTH domain